MAAAAAARRRALLLSAYSPSAASGLAADAQRLLRSSRGGGGHLRYVSQSGRKLAFLVDTLALVRRLEAQGIPSKQASAITEVLNDSLESVTQSFLSQGELQKVAGFH